MCRWLAYSGSPVLMEDLLYKPEHSLIVQSMHSTMGAETTNGDGFGVGWYGDRETPGVFRSTEPAWNDRNLHDLAAHITAPRVFAHIRAAIGSPVQQTNCHPFRHGKWLWMHNGFIDGFGAMKHDLAMSVDPALFSAIEGTTDTEMLFFLALTFGLESDPPTAVARAVGLVEKTARTYGIEFPVQLTVATTDGETTWAFRYSTEGQSRTLYHSTDIATLRHQYPDNPQLHELSEDTRVVVSEPLGGLRGAWREVPESTCVVIRGGTEKLIPFSPVSPPAAA
ncbi:MAG TPA: class II glutamine amidotransferase [Nocardioidaceae bacterium]|nr:class II glutamine amidotransferase [Nocardioidaceae bacterium]